MRPPPEMWSAVTASFARTEGWRNDRRNEGPEPDAGRGRSQPADRPPGIQRAAFAAVIDGDVVVGAKQGVEPPALARLREGPPVIPADILLSLDHEADANRFLGHPSAR